MAIQLPSPVNIFTHQNTGASFQTHCKVPLSQDSPSAPWVTGILKRESSLWAITLLRTGVEFGYGNNRFIFLFLWTALVRESPPFAELNWKKNTQTQLNPKQIKENKTHSCLSKNKLKEKLCTYKSLWEAFITPAGYELAWRCKTLCALFQPWLFLFYHREFFSRTCPFTNWILVIFGILEQLCQHP